MADNDNVEGSEANQAAASGSGNVQPEFRVRLPRQGQMLGIVQSRLGFGRMSVLATDGKIRVCRVPGKHRRQVWVKDNDIVLVEPWQFDGEHKADITYKYSKAQVESLRYKGLLKSLGV